MAEPAYILLAESGESDAHEVIRRVTLAAEKDGLSFAQALERESAVLRRIGGTMKELGLVSDESEALAFFQDPCRYSGLAAKKAREIAAKYKQIFLSADNSV
jgi:adenylosuccinate lyase